MVGFSLFRMGTPGYACRWCEKLRGSVRNAGQEPSGLSCQ